MRVAVATATTLPRQATPTRPARHPEPGQPEPGSRALTAQYRLPAARVKAACGAAPAGAPRTLTQATARTTTAAIRTRDQTGTPTITATPHTHNPANHHEPGTGAAEP